jgi:urease accessory protein
MSVIPIVSESHVHATTEQLASLDRDRLVLSAEERRWGRRRVKTAKGRELALALPTGTALQPGQLLYVGTDYYVVIEAAEEPVLVVTPRSRDEAIRVAFEVGNRHFSVSIDGDRLLVPDDIAMEQLLGRLGVVWKRGRAVFVPIGLGHRHD